MKTIGLYVAHMKTALFTSRD